MGGLITGSRGLAASSPMLGPLRVQTSTQGVAIPIVYGTTRINCNVIWYANLTAVDSLALASGKGGSGTSGAEATTTYTTAVALGLCEGPINGIGTVWANKVAGTAATFNFSTLTGTMGQAPFGYISTFYPAQALAYAGTAYVATGSYNLGSSTDLPTHSFEVSGLFAGAVAGLPDANPASIVTDFLTNPIYGAGLSTAQIGDMTAYAAYCAASGLLLSPAYEAQTQAQQCLSDIATVTNSAIVWSAGTLRLVPYGDVALTGNGAAYTPNLTPVYSLTDDDFLDQADGPVTLSRSANSDAPNHVMLEFLHRANQYNVAVIDVKDQASIDQFGLRPATPIQAHAICDIGVAALAAQLILQRQLYARNTYQFRLGWRYCLLEPMDIVAITDANLNLSAQPVRITAIEEDDQGALTITAEDLNAGMSMALVYPKQAAAGTVAGAGAGADPGTITYPD
jgi:hypothetical protein